MNKIFLKHIAHDLLLWSGILLGLHQGHPMVANAVLFVLWVLAVLAIASGLGMMVTDDDVLLRKVAKAGADRTPLHRRYAWASVLVEAVVLAALGYFWLASVYLLGSLLALAGYKRAEEKYQAAEEGAPC